MYNHCEAQYDPRSVFEFPAYSGKLGDLNAKWDAGRIVSEIHGDSFGPVAEVKFGTFTAENEDMSFIVKDINATRNKFNLGSIKFVEKVHDVDDKDTPVDEAAELAMKYAKPGDYIVHLGIGGTTSYNEVKEKLINGLNEGCKRYANN